MSSGWTTNFREFVISATVLAASFPGQSAAKKPPTSVQAPSSSLLLPTKRLGTPLTIRNDIFLQYFSCQIAGAVVSLPITIFKSQHMTRQKVGMFFIPPDACSTFEAGDYRGACTQNIAGVGGLKMPRKAGRSL